MKYKAVCVPDRMAFDWPHGPRCTDGTRDETRFPSADHRTTYRDTRPDARDGLTRRAAT